MHDGSAVKTDNILYRFYPASYFLQIVFAHCQISLGLQLCGLLLFDGWGDPHDEGHDGIGLIPDGFLELQVVFFEDMAQEHALEHIIHEGLDKLQIVLVEVGDQSNVLALHGHNVEYQSVVCAMVGY